MIINNDEIYVSDENSIANSKRKELIRKEILNEILGKLEAKKEKRKKLEAAWEKRELEKENMPESTDNTNQTSAGRREQSVTGEGGGEEEDGEERSDDGEKDGDGGVNDQLTGSGGPKTKTEIRKGRIKFANLDLTNVMSLLGAGRRNYFKHQIEHSDTDILYVTETNWNDTVKKHLTDVPGFRVVARSDRVLPKKKAALTDEEKEEEKREREEEAAEELTEIGGDVIVGYDRNGNPHYAGKDKQKESGGGSVLMMRDTIAKIDLDNEVKYTDISICDHRVQISGIHTGGVLHLVVYNAIFRKNTLTNHDKMFEKLTEIIEDAKSREPEVAVIIGGDWNIPKLIDSETFDLVGLKGNGRTDGIETVEEKFIRFMDKHDLQVSNSEPTRGKHTLDFFMVSRELMEDENTLCDIHTDFFDMEVNDYECKFDHRAVRLMFPMERPDEIIHSIERIKPATFNTRMALEYLETSGKLEEITFDETEDGIDKTHDQITKLIQYLQEKFCQKVKIIIGQTKTQWLKSKRSKTIRNFVKKCNKIIYKQRDDVAGTVIATAWKIKRKEAIMAEDDKNMKEAMRHCRFNMTKLSSFIKGEKNTPVPPLKNPKDNKMVYDDQNKADVLLEQFAKAMTEKTDHVPSRPRTEEDMEDVVVTDEMILNGLKKMKQKSAPGPDGIHTSTIVKLKTVLVPIFRKKLQAQLNVGYVPKANKVAHITAIPKKGNSSNPEDERPVQVTNVMAKLDESVNFTEVDEYRIRRNIRHPNQHGFREERGVGTIQSMFWWTVGNIINGNKPTRKVGVTQKINVHVLLCDFSKAFDKISWGFIMESLEDSGINDNNVARWYRSFLGMKGDRTIKVKVREALSKEHTVTSGNVQGSKSGPKIFAIAVEPLLRELMEINQEQNHKDANELHAQMYADDLKCYLAVERKEDHDKLKKALEKIATFCEASKMYLNCTKTCVMKIRKPNTPKDEYTYEVNGMTLACVSVFEDLGMIITDTRDMRPHYVRLRQKIKIQIAIIKKNLWKPCQKLVQVAYEVYIVPLVTQAAAMAYRCPPGFLPQALKKPSEQFEHDHSGEISKILYHQTRNFFAIGHLKRGIEASLCLNAHSILAWIREFNRMFWQPNEDGIVRFGEVWRESNSRTSWNIRKLFACGKQDEGNFFDEVHKFYNKMRIAVRMSNTAMLETRQQKCKSRKTKLTQEFKYYMELKTFVEARDIYLGKARAEKRRAEAERRRHVRNSGI